MSENKPVLIALVVVGILILGYVGYLMTNSEPDAPVTTQKIEIPQNIPEVIETPAPVPEPIAEVEPAALPEDIPSAAPPVLEAPKEPAFVLPRLDDSDQLIRDGVVSLTRDDGINAWLSPNELVRKFVVTVDNLANGSIPREAVGVLAPQEPFRAMPLSDDVFLLDQSSYERYDDFTRVVVSLDSKRAAEFYDLLRPLFQNAYDELGYPDKKFDEVIFQSVGRLLETPILEGDVKLVRPVVMYEFQDPDLESLSAAQKQMIRMGPKNTRLLQAKLSDMARELRKVLVD